MALTAINYHVLQALRTGNLLPAKPSVLELGEAEWYGDITPQAFADMIDTAAGDPERRKSLRGRQRELLDRESPTRTWDMAKLFYEAMLDYREIAAIDFHGTPAAKRLDLNVPVDLGKRFDMVIDDGTAEHVFNIHQFFKNCHDLTRPGGLMLHNNPFRGWLEHGFYNFNPTFYWDLAAANRYDVLLMVYHESDPLRVEQLPDRERIVDLARGGQLGANAMLFVAYRRPESEAPFAVPMQAYYANALSKKMWEAWYDLR